MKVKILRPVGLDGADYKVGVHEIPDAMASSWKFLAAKTNGWLLILEAPKPKAQEPIAEAKPIPAEPETYHEHMAKWESKAEKKAEDKPKAKRGRPKKKVAPKED